MIQIIDLKVWNYINNKETKQMEKQENDYLQDKQEIVHKMKS